MAGGNNLKDWKGINECFLSPPDTPTVKDQRSVIVREQRRCLGGRMFGVTETLMLSIPHCNLICEEDVFCCSNLSWTLSWRLNCFIFPTHVLKPPPVLLNVFSHDFMIKYLNVLLCMQKLCFWWAIIVRFNILCVLLDEINDLSFFFPVPCALASSPLIPPLFSWSTPILLSPSSFPLICFFLHSRLLKQGLWKQAASRHKSKSCAAQN